MAEKLIAEGLIQYKFLSTKQTDTELKVSFEIFKKRYGDLIEKIKGRDSLYLLYGKEYSGKTTVLRNIYYALNIDEHCKFVNGGVVFTPRKFFDEIGIEIKQNEEYKSEGKLYFRDFDKILLIDDFDKMIGNLGEEFAAYLRAMIQEFKISVVCTVTLESKEADKYILSYDTPFYRFFMPVQVNYESKEVKEIGNFFGKEISEDDTKLIAEISNDNVNIIISIVKNYDGNAKIAVHNTISENPSIVRDFTLDLTQQQRQILDDMCEYMLEYSKEEEGVKLNEFAIYLQSDKTILRTQINRIIKKGLIKKLGKKEGYVPNLMIVEKKKIEISKTHIDKAIRIKIEGRYDEAEKEYREAIKINPNNAEAHNNLGILLHDLKRFDEAEKEYREAIKIDLNDATEHINLGVLFYDLKRFDEAEKEYREAIKINPDYAGAHYNFGLLLKDLKRFDEAEKEYRTVIKINPNDAKAHYNLGNLLKDLNRFDGAEKEYREAIKINPNYAEAHCNLGALSNTLKRFDGAEKEYREAIKINPNLAVAHYNLGCLYSVKNDLENAVGCLKKAVEIDKNCKEKAKEDEDFENIKDTKEFKDVVG